MEAGRAALRTLRATSATLDALERAEPLLRAKAAVEPVPDETPKLLPTIHALWQPLVAALKAGGLICCAVTHQAPGDGLQHEQDMSVRPSAAAHYSLPMSATCGRGAAQ